jgi:hypothetical protein
MLLSAKGCVANVTWERMSMISGEYKSSIGGHPSVAHLVKGHTEVLRKLIEAWRGGTPFSEKGRPRSRNFQMV